MEFLDFPLKETLLRAIEERGFTEPTEIQEKAIPLLCEKDVDFVGQAQTGTGKTAAFALPLLNRINPSDRGVQAIILSPTRELANQICEEMRKFCIHEKIRVFSVYGGVPIDKQIGQLKKLKPQVIVGTPGRVKDLIYRKSLKIEGAKYAVLDEADEMLDMGFLDDVKEILANVEEKKTWMFSATMPKAILDLINNYLNEPEVIRVKKKTLSNENITQKFYVVKDNDMREAVGRLLDSFEDYYGIIFTKTKLEAKSLTDELGFRGFLVDSLHGDMDQKHRDHTMKKFKEKRVKLLVCTDVAARGIDVDHLTHVINFGLPQDLESYVHRIGRTGRAGHKGLALSVINPSEIRRIFHLENLTKAKILRERIPSVEVIKDSMVRRTLNQFEFLFDEVKKTDNNDGAFELFCDEFEDLSKEDVLDVMFKYIFNENIKRLDRNPVLDLEPKKRQQRKSVPASKIVPDSRGNVRLFVNVGKSDGVSLNDLIFNVSDELNLEKRKIRNVQLKDKFSFMDVPVGFYEKLVFDAKLAVGNKVIRFEPTDNHIEGASSEGRGRGNYRGGSGRNDRGGRRGGGYSSRGGNRGSHRGNSRGQSRGQVNGNR